MEFNCDLAGLNPLEKGGRRIAAIAARKGTR